MYILSSFSALYNIIKTNLLLLVILYFLLTARMGHLFDIMIKTSNILTVLLPLLLLMPLPLRNIVEICMLAIIHLLSYKFIKIEIIKIFKKTPMKLSKV